MTESTRRFVDEFPTWSDGEKPDEARFFAEALIVVDANVLLRLYQISADTRAEILDTFEKLKDDIWIPHQVVLEFSRNRKQAVYDHRKTFANLKTALRQSEADAIACLESAVTQFLKFRERHSSTREWDPAVLGVDMDSIRKKLTGILEDFHIELQQLRSEIKFDTGDLPSDFILEQLDELLTGRVGAPYSSYAMEQHVNHAIRFRFPNRIPPGYADVGDKPTELGQAGDYIVWRQLIDHMKDNVDHRGCVVFVTEDHKYDWWELDKSGDILEPRYELVNEMRDEAGVDVLMVSLKQFLAGAKKHLQYQISDEAISEADDRAGAVEAYVDSLVTPALNSDSEALSIIKFHQNNPAFKVDVAGLPLAQLLRNSAAVKLDAARLPLVEILRNNPAFKIDTSKLGLVQIWANSPEYKATLNAFADIAASALADARDAERRALDADEDDAFDSVRSEFNENEPDESDDADGSS
ncbi:PIN-like domain-containing protein [Nocardia sp. NPDC049526]|uniref:PIN-like domain-containing protein n=1 Tax=Nocardia sp. NPDC049526 TaxID=3364316 RepID=UPI00378BA5C9